MTRPKPKVERACAFCEKVFAAKPNQLYCSELCRIYKRYELRIMARWDRRERLKEAWNWELHHAKFMKWRPKNGTGRELLLQCWVCHRRFWSVRRPGKKSRARYCSAACRMRAMRRRRRVAKGKPVEHGEHREQIFPTPAQIRRRSQRQQQAWEREERKRREREQGEQGG
jgi:hypothetical protein